MLISYLNRNLSFKSNPNDSNSPSGFLDFHLLNRDSKQNKNEKNIIGSNVFVKNLICFRL